MKYDLLSSMTCILYWIVLIVLALAIIVLFIPIVIVGTVFGALILIIWVLILKWSQLIAWALGLNKKNLEEKGG